MKLKLSKEEIKSAKEFRLRKLRELKERINKGGNLTPLERNILIKWGEMFGRKQRRQKNH